MLKRFLSPSYTPWQGGLALMRIITGLLMVYHGWEVFDKAKMDEYAKWLTDLHFPAPAFMAYLGKSTEWVSGILLTLGLLTRLAVIPLAIAMTVVCFGMGNGRILTQDQHPFLFVLLAGVFFFTGPGKWSLDQVFFKRGP
ncbi:DoxX family protein [Chitinophaga agrisoli]|uniref:DoxX family protein n=1 Tax=Chitinophaga agrisoli TaxID=2607653 RepID=A0A5B2VUS2_9BACT|nr:DoxX family protein [Chitinophaga agrisoli]KAA2241829.1 DoxX family protein [Chitinophaga agrisoli]